MPKIYLKKKIIKKLHIKKKKENGVRRQVKQKQNRIIYKRPFDRIFVFNSTSFRIVLWEAKIYFNFISYFQKII